MDQHHCAIIILAVVTLYLVYTRYCKCNEMFVTNCPSNVDTVNNKTYCRKNNDCKKGQTCSNIIQHDDCKTFIDVVMKQSWFKALFGIPGVAQNVPTTDSKYGVCK